MPADPTTAELDQDGKMINPHNPEFITKVIFILFLMIFFRIYFVYYDTSLTSLIISSKVPWYLGNSGPTLKHHSIQKSDHVLSISETDNLFKQKNLAVLQKNNSTQKFYRKGACKNCGAMTHKEKDCVERPRSAKTAGIYFHAYFYLVKKK